MANTSFQPNTSISDSKLILLHGDLDLSILEARYLPNMDLVSNRLRRCITACGAFEAHQKKKKENQHHHHRKIITSDPYVTVVIAGTTVARTRVISNSQHPSWKEQFHIPLAHFADRIEFHVKDNDVFGADLIGIASIPADTVVSGQLIHEWFPVLGSSGKPPKPDTAIHLRMQFQVCEENSIYRSGLASLSGVRGTYFPIRKGSQVTLYQDAHVPDGILPDIHLENGQVFHHNKCWEDICHAISEAHHLIYMVGWSIFHKLKLIREPTRPLPKGGDLTLGELLKYKSEEGVRICILVWDDKTSHSKFFINTAGVMQTHDEETRKFFKHSSVICVLAPRYGSSKLSIFKQQVVGTLYTHHQKCVLVDTQASGNNRKITAFIGGLDMCDGRYDTPEHRLFRDLDSVFMNDCHNPNIPINENGPREPWHDLHCKIEGPAAYDVLMNFEQRWKKSTKWREFGRRFKRVSHWSDDALLRLERISWIFSPSMPNEGPSPVPGDDPTVWVSREEDPENWHVQVFRSIDSGSVAGFPRDVHVAQAQNLVCGKNIAIDKSIHSAYVQAIRCAQHFIYIENQYFLGSSFGWPSYKTSAADNLIPMELALKIASKIRAKERFAVYVLIPMWPEGVPSSASVQEILYWQSQTIQMMYDIVSQELKSSGECNFHPQDFLNFYCLGNREPPPKIEQSSFDVSQGSDALSLAQRFRRFMIYVHAKGMIIDDEYVILGSANINQRSMDGSRDTEIAMGAYQPHYTWLAKNRHPWGQVYGYRMSLWAEHLGELADVYGEPSTVECVWAVNEVAESNWAKYTSEDFSTLQGHLLKYPIRVDADGKVEPLPGHENFPDIGGKVLGIHCSLPDALTT